MKLEALTGNIGAKVVRGDLGVKVAAGIDDDTATVRMTGGCGLVHQSDSLRKKGGHPHGMAANR